MTHPIQTKNPSLAKALLVLGALVLVAASMSSAQVLSQVTHAPTGGVLAFVGIDDAGSTIWATARSNQFGDNPSLSQALFKFDAASGIGSKVSSFDGNVEVVSVSDDGQWLVFGSNADLVGQNADRSFEVFTSRNDLTAIVQLTSDTSITGGSSRFPSISGNGTRVTFFSSSNLTGGNPGGGYQLFIINRDGSGVAQLTNYAPGLEFYTPPSISDDATRISFASTGNLTGANADNTYEAFAINADGTGLRQLTNGASNTAFANLSGNGSVVAFSSDSNLGGLNSDGFSEVWAINWDGTGLTNLTNSLAQSFGASLSDDGNTIYFVSERAIAPSTNTDGNVEVWKINRNGTGLTLITSTTGDVNFDYPTVAGSGGRVAVAAQGVATPGGGNPDGGFELFSMTSSGTNQRQLTTVSSGAAYWPAITSDGGTIFYMGTHDPVGTNATQRRQIFKINSDGSGTQQLTAHTFDRVLSFISTTGDGSVITYTGWNGSGSQQIYAINGNGTNEHQVTNEPSADSDVPSIAANGSLIAYVSNSTTDGQEPATSFSYDVFVIKPDGTSRRRLTRILDFNRGAYAPAIDSTGTWVTYSSNANLAGSNADFSTEIYRVKSDGSSTQQVSSGPSGTVSQLPTISGNGNLIAWSSNANPLGSNADGNYEVFLRDIGAGVTRQLTNTTRGVNGYPRLSENGAWVYFISDAAIFEFDPDTAGEAVRVRVSDGAIERVSGLRLGLPLSAAALVVPDADGSRAAISIGGNDTNENPDGGYEIYLADIAALARISVSGGTAPTRVVWQPESGPVRYDIIRGFVASLRPGGGSSVDLGAVSCIENDSPDASTIGHEDSTLPAAGQAFFYIYRGTQGINKGPGSWGTSSAGATRVPSTGSCTD